MALVLPPVDPLARGINAIAIEPKLPAPMDSNAGEDDIFPSTSQVTITIQDAESSKIRISFGLTTMNPIDVELALDVGPGCGGTTWPAGRVLTEYLATRGRAQMTGKCCLELGSGTGLVGIAAAKLGARSVYITDQLPLIAIMEENVDLNDVRKQVEIVELSWGEPIPPTRYKPIDIILAADCVYFEPAYPLLIQTLRELHAGHPNAEFLFCYRQRRKSDKRYFLSLLKKHFDWKEVDDDPNREIYSRKAIVLLRLTAKPIKPEIKSIKGLTPEGLPSL